MIQNLAFELRGAARLLTIWGAAQPSQKLDIPVLAVLVYISCSISPWSEMIPVIEGSSLDSLASLGFLLVSESVSNVFVKVTKFISGHFLG